MPELRVPTWTKSKLANGAELIVSEKHDLPLVSFSITFLGGSDQFETADRRGVAEPDRLDDERGHEDAERRRPVERAAAARHERVGRRRCAKAASISFVSTTAQLRRHARHPRRHAGELHVSARSARTAARAAARRAGAGEGAAGLHRVARVSARALRRRASVWDSRRPSRRYKAITRADVVDFHQRYFKPGRALITVVGDVTPAAIRPVIERGLAGWVRRRRAARVLVSAAAGCAKPTTIYLVDKPGSAQSTFAIGLPGPPRTTPDYYALQVMNTILGGMFQARLNANIREEKGYSYGVSFGLRVRQGPDPFRTGGDIVGDKTDAALVEFMKELRGILGAQAGHRGGAADRQGIARAAPARHVRVGQRHQRRHHRFVAAVAARQLLPAITRSR